MLLAPSHRHDYRGIVVPDVDAFETPLGMVRIDAARVGGARPGIVRVDSRPFHGEHSLEIQLPFLQCSRPDVAVVPLLVRLG